MKEYSAYLFDMDNTLVDSSRGYERAFRAAFKEYGIPYDPMRYGEYIRSPLEATFSKHVGNAPCKYRDFYSIFANTYERTHLDSLSLFPDASRCIAELSAAGKKLGIVSNSETRYITAILSKLGVFGLFDSLVGYDRVSSPKPDPEPVALGMRELGSAPSETIMVGDSANDITAGNSAGTDTMLVVRDGVAVSGCMPTRLTADLTCLLEP
ncbi:MAG: HAD family hydrolase [Candidatus Methanoplasma sp.]|nr:HAD family hydrolase [Candidatus Methanoplasma sp.]